MFPWFDFFTYAFVSTITPGPNTILSMSTASEAGFKKSYPFNLGIYCGCTVMMGLCMVFSAALFALLPKIKPFMLAAAAVYMLVLAWRLLTKPLMTAKEGQGGKSLFLQGLALQFLNPKLVIYGVTTISSYILPHASGLPALAGFCLLLSTISLFSSVCWSLFGSLFQTLFQTHGKVVRVVMALLLVYCVVRLFV